MITEVYKTFLAIGCVVFLLPELGSARPLTPPNHPVDDSFFVCYQYRYPRLKSCGILRYYRYKYRKCIISRIPCCNVTPTGKMTCVHKESIKKTIEVDKDFYVSKKTQINIKPPICCVPGYKLFYWYNNYPQALNAFYRCAYSG